MQGERISQYLFKRRRATKTDELLDLFLILD